MVLASGTRVRVAYAPEATRGVTPPGITSAADIDSITNSATPGFGTLVRVTGSWVTDGYVVGSVVRVIGSVPTTNNTDYKVTAVTALTLTIQEFNNADAIVAEASPSAATSTIVLQTLRLTGRAINLEKDLLETAEVSSDRQISDVRHGFNRVIGTPGYELSLGAFDDLLELALSGTWTSVLMTGTPNLTVAVSGTGANDTVTITRDAGSWITDGFRIGLFVDGNGFTASNNNVQPIRILSLTATVLTCQQNATNPWSAEGSAVRTVDILGKILDIGTNLRTWLIEVAFPDVAQFRVFNGVADDQLQVNVQPAAIVGGTANLLGLSAAAMAGTSISATDPRAAATHAPFSAFDGELYEGGVRNAVVTGLQFTLANNRSLEPVVGSEFSPDVFEGRARINGTASVFFENATIFNKFENETESTLWSSLEDVSADIGDLMNLVVPRAKYTAAGIDPPQEGPITMEMPFTALKASLAGPGGTTVISTLTLQRSNGYPL